jgi:hypothetical protein
MKLGQKQERFSRDVSLLLAFIYVKTDFEIRFGEAQRHALIQKHYLDTGRSKTMKSRHLDKLAVDLFFSRNGEMIWGKDELQLIGDYWESLSPENSWGGNWKSFKDTPHFERRP